MNELESTSVEYLNVGYLVIDKSNAVQLINRTARDLLKSPEPVVSIDDVIRYLPEKIHLLDHITYCGIEHKSCSFREVPIHDTVVKIFLSPIFKDGELQGSLLTFEDVLEKLAHEKDRDQFLSFLVHEFRTPLTAIRGNASLINDYHKELLEDESVKSIVDDISTGSTNVLQMVNQFLEMASLEEGKIKYDLQEFDAVALIQETVGNLKVLAAEKGLELTIDTAGAQESRVVADPIRVKQVLTNLIGNGIKFTETGGIGIAYTIQDEKLEVAVTDSGPGIPPDSQSKLFQKFFQASNNKLRADSSKSTGLGLYVTKLMIEGMGGELRLAESSPDSGSTFVFTLDIATPERLKLLTKQRNDVDQGVQHAKVVEHSSVSLV